MQGSQQKQKLVHLLQAVLGKCSPRKGNLAWDKDCVGLQVPGKSEKARREVCYFEPLLTLLGANVLLDWDMTAPTQRLQMPEGPLSVSWSEGIHRATEETIGTQNSCHFIWGYCYSVQSCYHHPWSPHETGWSHVQCSGHPREGADSTTNFIVVRGRWPPSLPLSSLKRQHHPF